MTEACKGAFVIGDVVVLRCAPALRLVVSDLYGIDSEKPSAEVRYVNAAGDLARDVVPLAALVLEVDAERERMERQRSEMSLRRPRDPRDF